MKHIKIVFIIAVIVLLASLVPVTALAADVSLVYSGNEGELVSESGASAETVNLFAGLSDVMPGATVSSTVSIENRADSTVKVKLYMRSLGADAQSDDFLSRLHLTVADENSTPLFDGAANGVAGLDDWTVLGIMYSGARTELKLTLTVPETLDNSYSSKSGTVVWQFTAIEFPAGEEPWVCPNCHQSRYRIIDSDGYSVFIGSIPVSVPPMTVGGGGSYSMYLCEVCGHCEDMLCADCGGRMRRVIYRDMYNREWYYFACIHDLEHHTEPSPYTDDSGSVWIWTAAAVCSAAVLTVLIFAKRRKRDVEQTGAKPYVKS